MNNASPESTQRRIVGRRGTNPITWLQYQVEHTKDASPETLAHIRGLFRKLRAKKGHLHSLDDETAEREYIRIAYRLNLMRTQERIMSIKVTDKSYHIMSKTLAIYASAAIKLKSNNGKHSSNGTGRRKVPTAATSPVVSEPHDPESSDVDAA